MNNNAIKVNNIEKKRRAGKTSRNWMNCSLQNQHKTMKTKQKSIINGDSEEETRTESRHWHNAWNDFIYETPNMRTTYKNICSQNGRIHCSIVYCFSIQFFSFVLSFLCVFFLWSWAKCLNFVLILIKTLKQ